MEKNKIISNIKKFLGKINTKDFSLYFYVMDTKGMPSGSLSYIYHLAKEAKDMGYKVSMVHNEKEFIGVENWMGSEYSSIPHYNIETNTVKLSPSDILFIPEIFSTIMRDTKKVPCRRVVLCQNIDYIAEFIPAGMTWLDYGITDVITTTEKQKEDIESIFPFASVTVIPPSIPDFFKSSDKPKKLLVNILARDTEAVNRIAKMFYWKFPDYRWVTFQDVRSLSQRDLANALQTNAITVWDDDITAFGYNAVEAMLCDTFLIAKLPENYPEWMTVKKNTGDAEEEEFNEGAIWFTTIHDVHNLIANAVQLFIEDRLPSLYSENNIVVGKYTEEKQKDALDKALTNYAELAKKTLEEAYEKINNEEIKEK